MTILNLPDFLKHLKPCIKKTAVEYAMELTEDCRIRTFNDGILQGQKGDHLFQNSEGLISLIPKDIFQEKYRWWTCPNG